jgi:DNA repair exonuclease SbcCD ATPase subunit
MKYLLFTDPHCTLRGEFSKPLADGTTTYLRRAERSLLWVAEQILEHRPTVVACLGDLTETTGYVESAALQALVRAFASIESSCREVAAKLWVIVGNHDAYSVQHEIHNVEFLRLLPGVRVISRPEIAGPGVFVVPWIPEPATVEIPPETEMVLAHIDVKGGLLFKNRRADHGVDPSLFDVHVFNGHHHNPSEVSPRFHNIGALLSRNFSDVDSGSRGITLVERDCGRVWWSFVKNPHDIPFVDVFVNEENVARWVEAIRLQQTGFEQSYLRVKYDASTPSITQVARQLGDGALARRLEPYRPLRELSPKLEPQESKESSGELAFSQYARQTGASNLAIMLAKSILKACEQETPSTHTESVTVERLETHNYQVLRRFELDFEPGLYFIQGINEHDAYDANGVGKTTVYDAIYWALVGKSMRGGLKEEVISWGESWCRVEVSLKIGDKHYRVIRSIDDPEYGSDVSLINDTDASDMSARRATDTNKKILELLGRSPEVLKHAVFLTSGLSSRFTALSFPARVKLIEEVTNLEIYSRAQALAKRRYNRVSESVSLKTSAISKLLVLVEAAEARLRSIESSEDDRPERSVVDLEELQRANESETAELAEQIRLLQQDVDRLREKQTQQEHEVAELSSRRLRARSQLSSLDATKRASESQLRDAQDLIDRGRCPTCTQEISEDCDLHTRVRELKSSLEQNRLKREQVERASEILDTADVELQRERAASREQMTSMNCTVSGYWSKHKQLVSAQASIVRELMSLKAKESAKQSRLEEAQRNLHKLTQDLQESRLSLRPEQEQLEAYRWVVDALGTEGVRADLLRSHILPYLNSKVMYYSSRFGIPCSLDYRVTRGVLEEKIDVVFEGPRTYRSSSRGERRMIDLAVQWALADLAMGSSAIRFFVADEIVDPVDETTLSVVVELLRERGRDATVLLMSHRRFVDAVAKDTITLVKRDGFVHHP